MTPTLCILPQSPPEIRWQWHADKPWRDGITGEMTSYLAGFRSQDRAEEYGRMMGWSGK